MNKKNRNFISLKKIGLFMIPLFISTPFLATIFFNNDLINSNSISSNTNTQDIAEVENIISNDLIDFNESTLPEFSKFEFLKSRDFNLEVEKNKLKIFDILEPINFRILNSTTESLEIKTNSMIDLENNSLLVNYPFLDTPIVKVNESVIGLNDFYSNFLRKTNSKDNTFNFILSKNYKDNNQIGFYNPQLTTTFNVTNDITFDNEITPSDFLKNEFNLSNKIKVIYKNALPSTIYNTKITALPNDKDGTIHFTVIPGMGVNTNNEDITPFTLPSSSFTISGFKTPDPKSIDITVKYAQTYFVSPFDTENFFKDEIFQDEFVYPSIFDSTTDEKFPNKLKQMLGKNIQKAPTGFNPLHNIIFKKVTPNNIQGTLEIEWQLNFWIDLNGSIRNTLPGFDNDDDPSKFGNYKTTISGFKKLTPKPFSTSLPNEYIIPNDSPLFEIQYSPTLQPEINKLILSLFKNIPVNYLKPSNSNLINIRYLDDGSNSYIDVSIDFFGIFNDKGEYASLPFMETIRIFGFTSSKFTKLSTTGWDFGQNDQLAQLYSLNENIVIDDILKKNLIINLPASFNQGNIILTNRTFDNKLGIVNYDLSLNKYNDKDGVEQTSGFEPTKITISNFAKVKAQTSFTNNILQIGDPNLLAQDYLNQNGEIIALVEPFILNKVENYSSVINTKISIKEESFEFDNINGLFSFIPVITNYFIDDATFSLIENKPMEFPLITVSGFFKSSETRIDIEADWSIGNFNILPTNFLKNNIDDLKQMVFDRVISKPPLMTSNNILIDPPPLTEAFNLLGEIKLSFKFDRYFDGNGSLLTEPSESISITISGFNKAIPTTVSEVVVSNNKFIIPSEAIKDENAIKSVLINNNGIRNHPNDFTTNNIKILSIAPDNLTGEIKLKIALNNFYNDLGEIYNNPEFIDFDIEINIKGYKFIVPTSLPTDHTWKNGNSSVFPSIAVTDENNLKNIVYKNLSGDKPSGFNQIDNIIIYNITFNNLNGTINFDFDINKLYSQTGFEINSLPELYNVTITGYQSSLPTTINQNITLINYKETYTIDVTDNDLIDIIWENYNLFFSNIPFQISKEDILIDSPDRRNNIGIIIVRITTKTYYDSLGVLQLHSDNPLPFTQVIIEGFNKIDQTQINDGVIIEGKEKLLASDQTEEQVKQIIFDNRKILFSPIPNDFSIDNIIINKNSLNETSISYSNIQGSITMNLSILNYYNSQGLIEKDFPKNTNSFTIYGFKTVRETIIKSNFNLPSEEISNTLATTIKNDELKVKLIKNISSFASYYPTSSDPTDKRKFVLETVDIQKNSQNNIIGSLAAKIGYRNYYDPLGELKTTIGYKNVRINGFKKVDPTTLNSEFLVEGKEDILASNESLLQLKNIVMQNKDKLIQNLPNNVLDSDIDVKFDPFKPYLNSLGEVYLIIELYKYYDQSGQLIDIKKDNSGGYQPLSQIVVFKGYRKISQTSIKSSIIVLNYEEENGNINKIADKIPSDITTTELRNYIFDQKESIITSIPEKFTINDIIISELMPTNNKGTINAKISLKTYYDQNSELQTPATAQPLKQSIIFEGFKRISESTWVKSVLFLDSPDAKLIPPHLVNYKTFISYILNNNMLQNLPSSFNPLTDILHGDENSFTVKNNLDGYLTGTIKLKKYYSSNGNVVDSSLGIYPPLEQSVTIYGFKHIKPTNVLNYFKYSSSNLLASKENPDNLLNFIKINSSLFIENPVVDFNPNTQIIKLEIDSYDDIAGTLNVSIIINNYYDNYGNIIFIDEYNPSSIAKLKKWKITFDGYNKIIPTQISNSLLTKNSDKLASIQTNEEVKKIIYDERATLFLNLPEGGIKIDDIIVEIITSNNLTGTLFIKLFLKKYINSLGNTIIATSKDQYLQNTINIEGFKKISSTIISDEFNISESESLNLKLPTSITKKEIIDIIINNQKWLVSNSPILLDRSNFTEANIISTIPNNITGKLIVKIAINDYYSQSGSLINAKVEDGPLYNPLIGNISLEGFKTNNKTIAISFLTLSNDYEKFLPQFYYNDYKAVHETIFNNKDIIFTNLPSEVVKNDIVIASTDYNNIKGQVTVNFQLKKYYNNNGNLTVGVNSDTYKTFTIILAGFKKTIQTIWNNNINLLNEDKLTATEFSIKNKNFTEVLFNNRKSFIQNIPDDFTANNFIINSEPIIDDSLGKIFISYSVDNYYDSNGTLIVGEQSDLKNVIITGLTPIEKTSFINENNISNTSTKGLASEIFKSVLQEQSYNILNKFVFDNKDLYLENYIKDESIFNLDDIKTSSLRVNDINGTITFKLQIKDYYTETAELNSNWSEVNYMTTSGFQKNSPTRIAGVGLSKGVDVNGIITGNSIDIKIGNINQTPQEYLESLNVNFYNSILQLLNSNLENEKDINTIISIISDPTSVSNTMGSFLIEVNIENYYNNQDGTLVSNPTKFLITISGFKTDTNIFKVNTIEIVSYVIIGIILLICLFLLIFIIRYKYYNKKY